VVAYQTFSSQKPVAELSIESGEKDFYQTSGRYAQPFDNDLFFNVAFGASGQGKQDLKHHYNAAVTNQRGEGNYDNEIQDRSAIAKLFNSKDSGLHYEISLFHNSQEHVDHSGIGASQDRSNVKLGDQNFAYQNVRTNMFRTKLISKQSSDLSLELDTYYWRLGGGYDVNITSSSGSINTLFRDFEERKWGYHASIKHKLPAWNSEWVLKAGSDNHDVKKYDITIRNATTHALVLPKSTGTTDFSEQRIDNASIEARTKFYEKFTLTYGFRWDDYPDFGTQISPRASLIYQPTDKSSIKLIYGNAFRAPTVLEKSGSSGVIGDRGIKPEELDSWEIVYMTRGKSWKAELVAYMSEWEEGIVVETVTPTMTDSRVIAYANSAKNEAKGIEASFDYKIGVWRLYTNAAFSRSKSITSREDFTAYPKWIINSDLSYQFTQDYRAHLNLNFFDGHYLGDRITGDPLTIEKGHAFIRTDLKLNRTLTPDADIWINVKNVFDHDNTFPSIWSAEGGIPDINRLVSVGFKYTF